MNKPLRSKAVAYSLLLISLLSLQKIYGQVQTGKSYINVSKNITGGTFEPGDTLEIRAVIAVGSFSNFSIAQARYNDTIGPGFTYLPNSIKIITNEGLVFSSYTDAANDDAAMYDPANRTLRINLGKTGGIAANTGNAAAGGGSIAYNDKPSFYAGVCIMVASFRVRINALPYNSQVTHSGGAFRFTQAGTPVTVGLSAYRTMLFQNIGVCPNYVGGNAVIENNGSFGNGNTQNRSASAIVPGYSFVNFAAGQPNDGSYGICNNSSAAGAVNNGVAYPHSSRVFTVWDIIGDHTGAADLLAGNPPTAVGNTGGYMAVVNASYASSPAIQQTVSNLCPATYYDFSAWFRNICSKCSCDSNGVGALNTGFNGPYPPGVKPNLTFQLDGVDYYSTGDVPYNGTWMKKGFTYLTGNAQTSFTLSIRNNSPGGGGNDWAIDDINLSTCQPDLILKYNPEFKACDTSLVDLSSKIRCYFPNYIYYKWQKSINGGGSWQETGVNGVGSPVLLNGQWEYTAAYPQFVAYRADSGHRYRVVVATTANNLSSATCAYSNSTSTMLNILDCGHILHTQLQRFNGMVRQEKAQLKWSMLTPSGNRWYEVLRSEDGNHFSVAGIVQHDRNLAQHTYTDPLPLRKTTWYKIKIVADNNAILYSHTITLDAGAMNFEVKSTGRVMDNLLAVDYTLPREGITSFVLRDLWGNPVCRQDKRGEKGWNRQFINVPAVLPAGVYILSVQYNNSFINRKIIK